MNNTNNIYKLQLWSSTKSGGEKFRDLYFDVSQITGFYMPDDPEDDVDETGINILFNGDTVTIKQEDHIVKYLMKRFVDNCIKPPTTL